MPKEEARIPLTKSMLKECKNEDLLPFVVLERKFPHVARLIRYYQEFRQRCVRAGNNCSLWHDEHPVPKIEWDGIYRLAPDAKTEPGYIDVNVTVNNSGILSVIAPNGKGLYVTSCMAHEKCLGIWYEKDGKRELRTSMDLSFGRIVAVRFETE